MASPYFNVNGLNVSIATEELGDRAIVERWPVGGPPEADVVFKVAYSQRFTLVKYLRGGVTPAGKSFTYTPPFAYPPSPNLRCLGVGDITGIKPWTDSFGWVNYTWSLVPAQFRLPTWDAIDYGAGTNNADPSGLAFTTTRLRSSADVFQPPSGSYYYTAGTYSGKPVAESSVGIILPQVEISMTRHFLPFVPLSAILTYSGYTNSNPVTIADYTFPAGYLLFLTATTEPTTDPGTGLKAYDIELSLIGRKINGWNTFLDPSGAFVAVNTKSDGSGTAPYPQVDYSVLFGDTFS